MDELERGRRLARRRMAWISFGFLVATATVTFGLVLLSPDRTAVATALTSASPVLTGMMTVFTSIVLGYLGVSVVEKIFKKD